MRSWKRYVLTCAIVLTALACTSIVLSWWPFSTPEPCGHVCACKQAEWEQEGRCGIATPICWQQKINGVPICVCTCIL